MPVAGCGRGGLELEPTAATGGLPMTPTGGGDGCCHGSPTAGATGGGGAYGGGVAGEVKSSEPDGTCGDAGNVLATNNLIVERCTTYTREDQYDLSASALLRNGGLEMLAFGILNSLACCPHVTPPPSPSEDR